jgi:2,3-bisphosphoglycerate-independent phosphoglycerate mutase
MNLELMRRISFESKSKIVLMIIDGLGGLPHPETGKSELETASTPHMDELARRGVCGLLDPVAPGVTPGSGPGHLAIFGYNPLKFELGRGVLEASGIEFDLREEDVAARGNFATINDKGEVTDRRAGRISTEKNEEICKLLDGDDFDGVRVIVRPIKEHRLLAVFRGKELSAELSDTDPQKTGVPPRECTPQSKEAKETARIVNRFAERARETLSGHHPANMVLLRGFSKHPHLPGMRETYRLRSAAIAVYPMYRGLSKLLGMEVLDAGEDVEDQVGRLRREFERFEFFFLHVKHADSSGEDGNFEEKVKAIEKVDRILPAITDLGPDVFAITGDHSTPATLKGHSWHPVPVVLSSEWCRRDDVERFSESACLHGGLGRLSALSLMPLLMANARKLKKFGA